jgi:outer membrane protein assembly factor BamA
MWIIEVDENGIRENIFAKYSCGDDLFSEAKTVLTLVSEISQRLSPKNRRDFEANGGEKTTVTHALRRDVGEALEVMRRAMRSLVFNARYDHDQNPYNPHSGSRLDRLLDWFTPQRAVARANAEMWAEGDQLLLQALYARGNVFGAILKTVAKVSD